LIDPSILKTERPPVTCPRSKSYCGRRNRPTPPPALPAEAGSFIGAKRTFAETQTSAKCQIRSFTCISLDCLYQSKPALNRDLNIRYVR